MFHGWAAARGDLKNEENKKECVIPEQTSQIRLFSNLQLRLMSGMRTFTTNSLTFSNRLWLEKKGERYGEGPNVYVH
jgi:hypothetical protein